MVFLPTSEEDQIPILNENYVVTVRIIKTIDIRVNLSIMTSSYRIKVGKNIKKQYSLYAITSPLDKLTTDDDFLWIFVPIIDDERSCSVKLDEAEKDEELVEDDNWYLINSAGMAKKGPAFFDG